MTGRSCYHGDEPTNTIPRPLSKAHKPKLVEALRLIKVVWVKLVGVGEAVLLPVEELELIYEILSEKGPTDLLRYDGDTEVLGDDEVRVRDLVVTGACPLDSYYFQSLSNVYKVWNLLTKSEVLPHCLVYDIFSVFHLL